MQRATSMTNMSASSTPNGNVRTQWTEVGGRWRRANYGQQMASQGNVSDDEDDPQQAMALPMTNGVPRTIGSSNVAHVQSQILATATLARSRKEVERVVSKQAHQIKDVTAEISRLNARLDNIEKSVAELDNNFRQAFEKMEELLGERFEKGDAYIRGIDKRISNGRSKHDKLNQAMLAHVAALNHSITDVRTETQANLQQVLGLVNNTANNMY